MCDHTAIDGGFFAMVNHDVAALYRRVLRTSRLFKEPLVAKRFSMNGRDLIMLYASPENCFTLGLPENYSRALLYSKVQQKICEAHQDLDVYECILKQDPALLEGLLQSFNYRPFRRESQQSLGTPFS